LLLAGLSACVAPASNAPQAQIAVPANPTVSNYAQFMGAADEALQKQEPWAALGFFERAAKTEPAKKQPWLRMAQLQFEARNYGAAITAANEVLVRDNTDITAKSILAVSGLRVSSQALEQLRASGSLASGTHDEASNLVRTMRQSLGQSVFPNNDRDTSLHEGSNAGERRELKGYAPPPKRRLPPSVALPPVPQITAPPSPPKPPEPPRNPFDALKR
jgi:hypothetical protein